MVAATVVPTTIGVVGPSSGGDREEPLAQEVGRLVAAAGAVLVCGGLGGVMAAACRGAAGVGGVTVGILPGPDTRAANPWVSVAVATGMGELRNGIVVRTADALVAVGGGYGTLSEVALALRIGRPVIGLGTWRLSAPGGEPDTGVTEAADAREAVALAVAAARQVGGRRTAGREG